MKNLIIVAAVALSATATQAASFVWKTSGIKAVEGTGTITCSAILTAYATGTDDIIGTWNGNIVNGVLKDGTSTGLTISSDSFTTGSKYDFIFVATTTVDEQAYVWTSTKKTGVTAQATSTPSISWFAANHTTGEGINANGWAVAPEPTSGLLMLLGMAGLALRRKRM